MKFDEVLQQVLQMNRVARSISLQPGPPIFPVAFDVWAALDPCHWNERAVFHLATVLWYLCAKAHFSAI